MRIPCQKTWESTVGNGQQAKRKQISSCHSTKQQTQDHVLYTDGSVTKDQLGWVFIVKQDATTIHEDSAACTLSTFSLTVEVEAVTHALHRFSSGGDSQTTHAIIFTDSVSLLQKPRLECVNSRHPPLKYISLGSESNQSYSTAWNQRSY